MRYVYLFSLVLSALYPVRPVLRPTLHRTAVQQAQAPRTTNTTQTTNTTNNAKTTPAAAAPAASKPDYSKEPFVEEEYSMKIAFENDGTGTRVQDYRVRIQSDAGVQHYSVLAFPYESANQNITIDYVRVKKPDGTVVLTGPDGIQDMPADITRQAPYYSDIREKQVAVKGLGVGDVLETQVRWQTTKPLVPGQFWFSFNFSDDSIALHEELRISVPKDRDVKWASPGRQPTISTDGSRQVFTWTSSQLQIKSPAEQKKEQDDATYQTATGQLPPPDVQISSFQNWAQIGAWYNTLQRDRVAPDAAIRAKEAEITKDAPDDAAKLRAIYDYVSTQIRYIGVAFGIGRYQPHPAGEILANAYGDCKDKHTLLASLLAAAGIKAYPALIDSTHKIDVNVPSPAAFDHVITVVPQGKNFVWLDTTPEVAPYGYLLGVLRNKHALVIPDQGPATLALTPALPPAPSVQTFRIDATIGDDGVLKGKIERTIGGSDIALLLRAAFRSVSVPQWQTLAQRISYASRFAGDVSDVTVSSLADIEHPLSISYTYTRKDYPQWSEHRVAVALPPLLGAAPMEKPSHPIVLGDPGQITFESKIHVPKGYTAQLPAAVDLKEDFADYHAAYSRIADGFAVTRTMVIKMRELPPGKYDAYKKFSDAVNDDYGLYVGLTPTHITAESFLNSVWSLPDSQDAAANQAYDEASNYNGHNLQAEISALQRALQIDPKFTRARLWLSNLYAFERQPDQAIDASRSAVKNDPAQPLAYKVLGFQLMADRRFDDAIDVWRQLMKVAPDDEDARANLGSALLAAHRYSEAAAALESALKLGPKTAFLYQQLGSAYLQADDTARAVAAYKQAVALDSTPMSLNNVGYDLADASLQLPLALQYVQQAVKEEEQLSAGVELSNLKKEDLYPTTNLASFWDSLGWACFRARNLAQAERYLNAAWVLSESTLIGEHLGETYEAEHKKRDAIRVYRLALGASRDSSQTDDILLRLHHLGAKKDASGPRTQIGSSVGAELSKMRMFKIPGLNVTNGHAEFFLLFDAQSGRPEVRDVKFIRGSDELKDAGKFLKATDFKVLFPDDGPERLLRRGILYCDPLTKCSFVLYPPGWNMSIN